MAGLRRVLQVVARFLYRDTAFIHGEFTGANGSVGTGNKFKGVAVLTRSGEGVYVLTLVQDDGATALKGYSIKGFNTIAVAPNSADGGSGTTEITTDALNASGTVTFTTRNLAGAAADVIGRMFIELKVSPEANAA